MSDGKKRSFLATLDLKDGTKLGFSKIAAGGYHPEGVEELCANSLLKQSIKIRFEPNDEGYYVMIFKGFAPADKVPSKTDGPWGYAAQGIVHVANKEHIPESQSDVASNTSPIYLAVAPAVGSIKQKNLDMRIWPSYQIVKAVRSRLTAQTLKTFI